MTAAVTCFISAKGGSGKTVTSSSMGTFLSALGFRVLLVDTDAATNGMTLLYLEQLLGARRRNSANNSAQVGLFDSVGTRIPTPIHINQNLDFVPATFSMTDTENADPMRFRESLTLIYKQRENYDFIFLDAQAGTDVFAKAAAAAADQCVIVSEYDPVSAQGIERLKVLFSDVLGTSSTWTLFNKVLPEFAHAIGDGLSIARYLTPLPWDADVVRAFGRRDLAINMESPNAYTLAIAQVIYNLFPDETGNAIESWRGDASQAIMAPIQERLDELFVAEKRLQDAENKRELTAKLVTTVTTGAGAAVTVGIATSSIEILHLRAIFSLLENANAQFVFLALASTVVVGASFYLYAEIRKRFEAGRTGTEKLTFDLIHQEQAKLKATLEAAEAMRKVTENAGYYERRRREPSPTRAPKG